MRFGTGLNATLVRFCPDLNATLERFSPDLSATRPPSRSMSCAAA